MMMSLLDIAVKKCGEENATSDKRTLVFAGAKSVGKTTLVQRFLDKNDLAKETLALEYSFGRKSGRSLNKDVCHIWELGGGIIFSSLLPIIFGNNNRETTLIVVVDLSAPSTLWITLETILQTVYNHLNRTTDMDLMAAAHKRIPDNHEDKNLISPFPVPLVIIGGKYDLHMNQDPEEKKLIARTLRLVAHSLAASLLFYTEKDASIFKRMKDLLNHHGFGGAPCKGINTDINKPLFVPHGSDSFAEIGSNIKKVQTGGGLNLDIFKHSFTSYFPQDSNETTIPDDPAKDPHFLEPLIDSLRSQRDEELDRTLEKKEKTKKVLFG